MVLSQFRRQVQPMHRRFVTPQRRNAHLIVRSPVAPSTLRRMVGCLHSAATDAPPTVL
jgi:uridine kinase